MATTFTKSTAPGLTKNIPARLEELILTNNILGWVYDTALSVTIPSFTAGGANTSTIAKVDVTVTGVAVGDLVVAADPTVALPTNCLFLKAYVSATDTVTFIFGNATNAAVTGAAKTFSVILADCT